MSSPSAAYCKTVVSPHNNSPVIGITSASVPHSSYVLVTRDFEFSESITVPDMDFTVPEVVFVAS